MDEVKPRSVADSLAGPDPRWYAKLFDQLGRRYEDYPFTRGSEQEVAFLLAELALVPGERVIDIGCGTARHAIELSRAGLSVTGVDLSIRLLEIGLQRARERGVLVNLIHTDAREIDFGPTFDLGLSLCEGAFGLLESDDENRRLLARMRAALKPGGRLALNALHRDFIAARRERFAAYEPVSGFTESAELMTFESGRSILVHHRDRAFSAAELAAMVTAAGFTVTAVHGCQPGDFGRHPVTADHPELLLLGVAG